MIGNSRGLSKTSALIREIRRKFREVGIGGTLKLAARKLLREIPKLKSLKKQNLHPFDPTFRTKARLNFSIYFAFPSIAQR